MRRLHAALLVSGALCASGCRSLASGVIAGALSGSGGAYAEDDVPELVERAVPFALKTMEGVLVEQPEHVGLLTSLASGFVQYGYAFVQQDADRLADGAFETSQALREQCRKLYLRAKGYGLRGLEVRHEGFVEAFARDPEAAVNALEPEDVPLAYWTAAAWALSIGASNLAPEAVADFPAVGVLARRALALDEGWGDGAVHDFLVSYEAARPGGSPEVARRHFERSLALSGGRRAGVFVALAEGVAVKAQDAREFHRLLDRALAIDVDRHPGDRLANVIAQRRARRLKAASADLFLEDVSSSSAAAALSEVIVP